MNEIKKVCVFCGSSFGDSSRFKEAAEEIGKFIADREMELVFGGGNVGLMGTCARACMENGGRAVGIIPKRIHDMVEHVVLSEIHVVEDMHERKAMMYKFSDCFIALPGGIGTLEEIFEAYTWMQLGYMSKPVGILNTDNFYTMLLQFLDSISARGFLKEEHRAFLKVSDSVEELFDLLFHTDLSYVRKL